MNRYILRTRENNTPSKIQQDTLHTRHRFVVRTARKVTVVDDEFNPPPPPPPPKCREIDTMTQSKHNGHNGSRH